MCSLNLCSSHFCAMYAWAVQQNTGSFSVRRNYTKENFQNGNKNIVNI